MNFTEFRDAMAEYPVFSTREIEKYFPDFDSRRLVEWQEKGYILRIRNRYYLFSDRKIDEYFLFYTSNRIYSPSYVTLESALSRYGIIPEGVFQITACTTRKTQAFDTPLGRFGYRQLKPELYFGYRLEEWDNHRLLVADPEKTLIDYLYLHSEIEGTKDLEALRWNPEILTEICSMDRLEKYETYIASPALSRRLDIMREYLHVEAG